MILSLDKIVGIMGDEWIERIKLQARSKYNVEISTVSYGEFEYSYILAAYRFMRDRLHSLEQVRTRSEITTASTTQFTASGNHLVSTGLAD